MCRSLAFCRLPLEHCFSPSLCSCNLQRSRYARACNCRQEIEEEPCSSHGILTLNYSRSLTMPTPIRGISLGVDLLTPSTLKVNVHMHLLHEYLNRIVQTPTQRPRCRLRLSLNLPNLSMALAQTNRKSSAREVSPTRRALSLPGLDLACAAMAYAGLQERSYRHLVYKGLVCLKACFHFQSLRSSTPRSAAPVADPAPALTVAGSGSSKGKNQSDHDS